MASPKKLETTALLGLILQAGFSIACFLVGRISGSRAVQAEAYHMTAGLLVWFVVLVHGRQRRLAREEREERDRLKETRLSEEIFQETELDTMRASSGLLLFEKYLVPLFSVALSGLLFYFVFRVWRQVWDQEWTVAKASAVAVSMVSISFIGYLVGKYAAGLAQNRGFRLLRAAGGYMLGNVIACILIAVAMAMDYFNVHWGETVVAYVIPAMMALVGVEVLLNLVLDIYRPRIEGQEARPPYDSRLLGLFAEPQGVLRTVAATLDYQFGFRVSETWFYGFMERAIVPLVMVQVVSLWLLTTMVLVDPDEIVFIETLGKPYVSAEDAGTGLPATLFEPGFYFKAPWPISIARHVPAYRVHSLAIGKVHDTSGRMRMGAPVMKDPNVILWRELHISPTEGYEASFLVPSTAELQVQGASQGAGGLAQTAPKVNLARLEAWVYYRVKRKPDGRIDERAAFSYQYGQADVNSHVERLAYRSICRVAASQDFLKWIADERGAVAGKFRELVSDAVERAGLGVEVVDVAISAVHPPAEVARAYEMVVAALEARESMIQAGEQVSIRTKKQADARAAELVAAARAYAYRQSTTVRAEADQFDRQYGAYQRAPLVYMFRTYFDTIERALSTQRLFVVPVSAEEVQVIDLQEKLRTDLLDVDILEG